MRSMPVAVATASLIAMAVPCDPLPDVGGVIGGHDRGNTGGGVDP